MFHTSFSYEPSPQYGINLFSKTIIKNDLIVTGVSGKSGFFLIELPIELPIGPCYSLVEEQGPVIPLWSQ